MGNTVQHKRRNPTNCLGCMGSDHDGFDPNELQIGLEDNKPRGRITQQSTAYLTPDEINFFKAAAGRNLSLIRFYLSNGININLLDEDRTSPLHIASRYGSLQVVEELISNCANLNITDMAGWTPLHVGAFYQRSQVCALLLRYGADPKIRNRDGNLAQDLVRDKMTSEVFKLQQDGSQNLDYHKQKQRDTAKLQYEEYFNNLKQKKQKNYEVSSYSERDVMMIGSAQSKISPMNTPQKLNQVDKENLRKEECCKSNYSDVEQEQHYIREIVDRESVSYKMHLLMLSPGSQGVKFYDESFSLSQMVFEKNANKESIEFIGAKELMPHCQVLEQIAVEFFNYTCFLGISFMIATQIVKPCPISIVNWLLSEGPLMKSKKQTIKLLTNSVLIEQPLLLKSYVDNFITQQEIIPAIRDLFQRLQVPTDPYILDQLVKELSRRVFEIHGNQKSAKFPFQSADSLHMFTFAIVMLDIEISKYGEQEAIRNFINNTQTINNGANLSQGFVNKIIDEVIKHRIVNIVDVCIEESLINKLSRYSTPLKLIKYKDNSEWIFFCTTEIGILLHGTVVKVISRKNNRVLRQKDDITFESKYQNQQCSYIVCKDNQTFIYQNKNMRYRFAQPNQCM